MSASDDQDLWNNVQDALKVQRYPDVSKAVKGVHTLRDLVTSSVHLGTGSEPVVSLWTAQTGDADDIILGYQSLIDFLCYEKNAHKMELQVTLIYPLFVYCYFIILNSKGHEEAQQLYASSRDAITSNCSTPEELQEVLSLTTPSSVRSSSLAKRFEGGKYFTRISEPSFMMLMTFLQAHPTTALLNVIQKYFDVEIVGGTVQTMNNELKSENKKSCPFIKPNIEPIPPSELAMATPRRPHVPSSLPVPPNSDEVLMAKHDFQQKLTLASQQLDPSIPSILLCAVHTSKSVGLHCAAVTNKSETPAYACGREDSSIVVSSWLPRERGDSFNNIQTLRGHYGPIFGVDYSHDGRYLISSSEDTTVKLWDANSGDCLVKYSGHTYPVFDVSFSSVDGYFVTSSFDYTSRLWNTDRVYPLRIFTGHEDSVNVARFHPNGNYVATGSKDYTCRLWDINTGGCVRLLTGSKNPISALAFSPFGKHLASATTDGTITIWEISSGQAIRTLKEHTANITSLFYTCDSTLLASTSMDNTIKLWNVKAILSQNDSSGSINDKCLMHTQSVGPILPLHGQFTHRNCLVTIGVQYQEKLADNSIQTHFSKF